MSQKQVTYYHIFLSDWLRLQLMDFYKNFIIVYVLKLVFIPLMSYIEKKTLLLQRKIVKNRKWYWQKRMIWNSRMWFHVPLQFIVSVSVSVLYWKLTQSLSKSYPGVCLRTRFLLVVRNCSFEAFYSFAAHSTFC